MNVIFEKKAMHLVEILPKFYLILVGKWLIEIQYKGAKSVLITRIFIELIY